MAATRRKRPRTMAAKAQSCENSDDRLSNLPSDIIIQILLLLPMVFAVRTTILSKRWRNLWSLVPSLKFTTEEESTNGKLAFIRACLRRHKAEKIDAFILNLGFTTHTSEVDSCIEFALRRGVEHLNLDMSELTIMFRYKLPKSILDSRSLAVLSLTNCKIREEEEEEKGVYSNLQFHSLRRLSLKNVNFINGGAICRSPALEYLSTVDCHKGGNFDLVIIGKSLKTLTIHEKKLWRRFRPELKVYASDVESFDLVTRWRRRSYVVKPMPKLERARLGCSECNRYCRQQGWEANADAVFGLLRSICLAKDVIHWTAATSR